MSITLLRLFRRPISHQFNQNHIASISSRTDSLSSAAENVAEHENKDEFMALELYPAKKQRAKRRQMKEIYVMPPRSNHMKLDQDWPSVWPAARSFHPGSVPLPIRMGYPASNKPTPDKWANAELMKIPNFLHLTPPAVQRHCAAIRKFCTPWPKGVSYPAAITTTNAGPDPLKKELVKKKKFNPKLNLAVHDPLPDDRCADPGYFPAIETKSSYLYSGPSIRDARARKSTFKVHLSDLNLDDHSRDKMLRLVRERFDRESQTLTIEADRCPLHNQNSDYCHYLLTVIRAESENVEPWEHEINRLDHSEFLYANSSSEQAVGKLKEWQENAGTHVVPQVQEQQYTQSLTTLLNEGENDTNLAGYSSSVLGLLGIEAVEHEPQSCFQSGLPTPESLPEANAEHLYSWRYQESKKVVWIEHLWTKGKSAYWNRPPF